MLEIPILTIKKNLLVPLQIELDDIQAKELQLKVLTRLERDSLTGLIIDITALSIVDSFLGRIFGETADMASLLGVNTVLVGMRKEIAISLVFLGLDIARLNTALDLEQGMELLDQLQQNTISTGGTTNGSITAN